MVQKKRKYFVTGHTAKGFVNFFEKNLYGIERIITIKHESNTIMTEIIQTLKNYYDEQYDVEVICSPQSKSYIEGIIIRSLRLAIVSNNVAPHENDCSTVFTVEDDMSRCVDWTKFKQLKQKQKELYEESYQLFQQGLDIHTQVEKIYINEMDFKKADGIAHHTIHSIFKNQQKRNRESVIYERLFGTNTSEGVVNLIPFIIKEIGKVVHIKGRAGTGKSVFMKNILNACIQYGFDVEVYRCSFDPNSVDMIVIRDLDICFFDSTPPHEFTPTESKESVIDLYESTVTQGTDEKYQKEIGILTRK